MNFKPNPIQSFLIFLSGFAIFATIVNFKQEVLIHLALTLGFSVLLFYVFTFLFKKTKSLPNTIITAIIIFLVLHYEAVNIDYVYTLVAIFVAIFSKFFLEYRSIPVINPAVLGLLFVAIFGKLFPSFGAPFISWWGASFQGYVSLVLITLWLIFGLKSWQKLSILGSFLLTYVVLLLGIDFIKTGNINTNIEFIKFALTNSTIYFYIAIMLIEPKSSPFKNPEKIIYGVIAGFVYVLVSNFHIPYYDLISIAVANLYNFALRIKGFRETEKRMMAMKANK